MVWPYALHASCQDVAADSPPAAATAKSDPEQALVSVQARGSSSSGDQPLVGFTQSEASDSGPCGDQPLVGIKQSEASGSCPSGDQSLVRPEPSESLVLRRPASIDVPSSAPSGSHRSTLAGAVQSQVGQPCLCRGNCGCPICKANANTISRHKVADIVVCERTPMAGFGRCIACKCEDDECDFARLAIYDCRWCKRHRSHASPGSGM